MTNYTIRRATHEDANSLAFCIDAAYAPYYAKGLELPPVSKFIENDIAENIVWVAEQDSHIIGGLILVLNSYSAKLANIAVHPSAGGMGIGRALIEVCEKHLLNRYPELLLTTHKDMPENVKLYEHLGWQVTGFEGDKVFMAKTLLT